MMDRLAPDTGDSIALQLDELGRNYRPPNALESVTAGRLLLQVKTATPHGEFTDRVKSLGIDPHTATRLMACARSFDPERDSALLTTVKSRGKLVELLVLEPVEIEALRLGEEVFGLTLERLESMTVLELRGALREARGKAIYKPSVRLTPEEETLLRNYRKCGPQARAHVAQAAELLAGR